MKLTVYVLVDHSLTRKQEQFMCSQFCAIVFIEEFGSLDQISARALSTALLSYLDYDRGRSLSQCWTCQSGSDC